MTARRTLFSRGFLAALALVALTSASKADEVYSNFGPGNSYQSGLPWGILGSTVSTIIRPSSLAGKFTAGQNFTLTGFEMAGYYVSGTNSFLFSIVSDNAGLPTGTSIFSTSSALPTVGTVNSFAATGSLLAGNSYWLVMAPGASSTLGSWYKNSTGGTGMASNRGTIWEVNSTDQTPAFRINGTPVAPTNLTPEVPAGVQVIPILLAIGGMALYQRRKQRTSTL